MTPVMQKQTPFEIMQRFRGLKEVGVNFRSLVNFHLLEDINNNQVESDCLTNHFEVVELLLDLLSKKRSQPVACSNLSASVVLATRPCLVELDPRAEDETFRGHGLRSDGCTLRFSTVQSSLREIVLASNLNPIAASVSRSRLVFGGARSTRVRRVTTFSDLGCWRRDTEIRICF